MLPKTRSGKMIKRVLKRVWTGVAVGGRLHYRGRDVDRGGKEAASRMKILRG
jgi:hypothetical protein